MYRCRMSKNHDLPVARREIARCQPVVSGFARGFLQSKEFTFVIADSDKLTKLQRENINRGSNSDSGKFGWQARHRIFLF